MYQLITSVQIFRPNKNCLKLSTEVYLITLIIILSCLLHTSSSYNLPSLPVMLSSFHLKILCSLLFARYSVSFTTLKANLQSQSRELKIATVECYNQTVTQGKYFINKSSNDSSVGIATRMDTICTGPPFLAWARVFNPPYWPGGHRGPPRLPTNSHRGLLPRGGKKTGRCVELLTAIQKLGSELWNHAFPSPYVLLYGDP